MSLERFREQHRLILLDSRFFHLPKFEKYLVGLCQRHLRGMNIQHDSRYGGNTLTRESSGVIELGFVLIVRGKPLALACRGGFRNALVDGCDSDAGWPGKVWGCVLMAMSSPSMDTGAGSMSTTRAAKILLS